MPPLPKPSDSASAGQFSAVAVGDEQALAAHVSKPCTRTLLDLLGTEATHHTHAEPGCTTYRLQEILAEHFPPAHDGAEDPHGYVFYAGGRHMLAESDAYFLDLWDRYEMPIHPMHLSSGGPAVFAVTIAPFGGHPSWTPALEARRQEWNGYVRGRDHFDYTVDADALLRDPTDHTRLNPLYDAGDGYLYNQAAHDRLAQAMHARIFRPY